MQNKFDKLNLKVSLSAFQETAEKTLGATIMPDVTKIKLKQSVLGIPFSIGEAVDDKTTTQSKSTNAFAGMF